MITVVKVWQAKCEVCGRILEHRRDHVSLVAAGIMGGWVFQYQAFAQTPRYNWAAYCPDHTHLCCRRPLPNDLRCGVTRMRQAVAQLGMLSEEFIRERVR
jgi:hypothetical protein